MFRNNPFDSRTSLVRTMEQQPIIHRLIPGERNPTHWSTGTHITWYADDKHLENPNTIPIIIQLDEPCMLRPCPITHNGLDIIKHNAKGWLYHNNNRYALKSYNLLSTPRERRKLLDNNHCPIPNQNIKTWGNLVWEIQTHTEPE